LNARLRRNVETIATIVCISGLVGVGYGLAQSRATLELIVTSTMHGVGIGLILTLFEIWLDRERARGWLASLSFTSTLILRSLAYVLVIVAVHLTIMDVRRRLGFGASGASLGPGLSVSDALLCCIEKPIEL